MPKKAKPRLPSRWRFTAAPTVRRRRAIAGPLLLECSSASATLFVRTRLSCGCLMRERSVEVGGYPSRTAAIRAVEKAAVALGLVLPRRSRNRWKVTRG